MNIIRNAAVKLRKIHVKMKALHLPAILHRKLPCFKTSLTACRIPCCTVYGKILSNLSLQAKLAAIIAIMSLLSIGVGVIGPQGIKNSNDSLKGMYQSRIVSLQELKVMSDNFTINIVDTCHKVKDGHMAWALGRKEGRRKAPRPSRNSGLPIKTNRSRPKKIGWFPRLTDCSGLRTALLPKPLKLWSKKTRMPCPPL